MEGSRRTSKSLPMRASGSRCTGLLLALARAARSLGLLPGPGSWPLPGDCPFLDAVLGRGGVWLATRGAAAFLAWITGTSKGLLMGAATGMTLAVGDGEGMPQGCQHCSANVDGAAKCAAVRVSRIEPLLASRRCDEDEPWLGPNILPAGTSCSMHAAQCSIPTANSKPTNSARRSRCLVYLCELPFAFDESSRHSQMSRVKKID